MARVAQRGALIGLSVCDIAPVRQHPGTPVATRVHPPFSQGLFGDTSRFYPKPYPPDDEAQADYHFYKQRVHSEYPDGECTGPPLRALLTAQPPEASAPHNARSPQAASCSRPGSSAACRR